MNKLVVDSNVALDLLVFDDAAVQPLKTVLAQGSALWIATAAMRAELERVLDYPKLAPRVAFHGLDRDAVLARFDALAQIHPEAPRAPLRCQDPDDQIFINLAVAHGATLLSKDRHVLRLARRLLPWGVVVTQRLQGAVASGQQRMEMPPTARSANL